MIEIQVLYERDLCHHGLLPQMRVKLLAEKITGVIINYRLGPRSQKSKEYIIKFAFVADSKLNRLIGRKIVWKSGSKRIPGKIIALHGKKGLVRVRFRKGLPGQALGGSVQLIG